MKINITFNGETRQVNFTKPQAAIINRLLNGERVETVNCHRMSGGDFIWASEYGYEFVGVRAFNGAMLAVRKAFNFTPEQGHAFYRQWFV